MDSTEVYNWTFPFPSNGTVHLNMAKKKRYSGVEAVFPFPSNGTVHLNVE